MPAEPRAMRAIRALLPYTTAAVVLAALYVAWVFISRWDENRRLEQAAAAHKAKAEAMVGALSGDQLQILDFYVTPGAIRRGERALVCYGVLNARSVKLDPPVERVYPAISRCFAVAAERDTRYTLTAEDARGKTAEASFLLQVR